MSTHVSGMGLSFIPHSSTSANWRAFERCCL